MINKLIYICCILSVFAFAACAQPPVAEMEKARDAVFKAENDPYAVLYANSSLASARESLRRMQEEADSKRYDTAKAHALDAIAAAEKAVADGKSGAQRAGGQSDALITTLRTEIDETSRNINGARYSNMALDYDALDKAIIDAYATTDLAEIDQVMGRYDQAQDRARIVRSDLADINHKVAGAVNKRKK